MGWDMAFKFTLLRAQLGFMTDELFVVETYTPDSLVMMSGP